MVRGLAVLLLLVLATYACGLGLYQIYRTVRRENARDAEDLRRAAQECEEAADRLERNIKK